MFKKHYHPAYEKTPITEAIALVTYGTLYLVGQAIMSPFKKASKGLTKILDTIGPFPEDTPIKQKKPHNLKTTNGISPLGNGTYVDVETEKVYDTKKKPSNTFPINPILGP